MTDDADRISNVCTDLVSLRRLEPGVSHLLRERPPGEWTPVANLYAAAGSPIADIGQELLAAWLPSPHDPNYAVILFFDDDSKWSQTAEYHAKRLLGRELLTPVAAAG